MIVRRTSHLEASCRSPPLVGNMVTDKNAQAVSHHSMAPHPISPSRYAIWPLAAGCHHDKFKKIMHLPQWASDVTLCYASSSAFPPS